MTRRICVAAVLIPALLLPAPAAETPETAQRKLTALKSKILGMPAGSPVTINTLDKKKVFGRLGEVTDEGFTLRGLVDGKIVSQKLGFSEVAKVQPGSPQPAWKSAGKTLFYLMSMIGTAGAIVAAVRK